MFNIICISLAILLILIIESIFSIKLDKMEKFEGTYEELPKEQKEKINDAILVISVCRTAYFPILIPCLSNSNLEIIPRIILSLLFFGLDFFAEKKYFLYKTINKKIYNLMRISCVIIVITLCLL